MATLFEPSLTSSIIRPPLSSASAPSMADTLPTINFGFDDLRERMSRFTDRFDNFIAKGRKRVLEERNQFHINVAELHEDQRLKKLALETLTHQTSTHTNTLRKEAAELSDLHASIATLTTQRNNFSHHRTTLLSSIAATQSQISQRLAGQSQHASALDAQSRLNMPELEFWTDYLCMRIEGAGVEDRLKFVFSHLDERDWEREGWFELDTARRDYAVVGTRPKVEAEGVEGWVERLNESRDLGIFLKGMRELLVEAMK